MKIKLKLTILLLSLSLSGYTREQNETVKKFNLFAGLGQSQNSIKTKESSTSLSTKTSTTYTSLNAGLDYFILNQYAISGKMMTAISSSINSEIFGFDLALKYYLKRGYGSTTYLNQSILESTPPLSYFLQLGFANRNYQFSNANIAFQGPYFGGGIDSHMTKNYFIRGELNLENLANTSNRNYFGITLLGSIGFKF